MHAPYTIELLAYTSPYNLICARMLPSLFTSAISNSFSPLVLLLCKILEKVCSATSLAKMRVTQVSMTYRASTASCFEFVTMEESINIYYHSIILVHTPSLPYLNLPTFRLFILTTVASGQNAYLVRISCDRN